MFKRSLVVCVATVLLSSFFPAGTHSFEIGRRYLDYGNGMINMDNITHIDPQIRYVVTLPQDDHDHYFKEFRTSDMSKKGMGLSDVPAWFEPDKLAGLDYYFLEIEGYIKFDDFTLTMVKKRSYLKIPSDQDIERVRAANGEKFTKFLERLQTSRPEVRSASPLRRGDSLQIKLEIAQMAASYRKIYDGSSWWAALNPWR